MDYTKIFYEATMHLNGLHTYYTTARASTYTFAFTPCV
jgi:hypothetical protein